MNDLSPEFAGSTTPLETTQELAPEVETEQETTSAPLTDDSDPE